MQKHITGQSVADYMHHLMGGDGDGDKKQASQHTKDNVAPGTGEEMCKEARGALRENPVCEKKPKKAVREVESSPNVSCPEERSGSSEEGKLPPSSGTGCSELINQITIFYKKCSYKDNK